MQAPAANPVSGQPRMKKKRRRPCRTEDSLVCLIQSLVDRKVVVELRNDVLLRGMLDDVDEYMNLSMSAVTYHTVQGYKKEYESMYIKGRNIRCVHLPRSLDPAQAIEGYRQKLISAKIQNAKERARELGSGKRAAKGMDAAGATEEGLAGTSGSGAEGEAPAQSLGGAAMLDPRALAAAAAQDPEGLGSDLYYSSSSSEDSRDEG